MSRNPFSQNSAVIEGVRRSFLDRLVSERDGRNTLVVRFRAGDGSFYRPVQCRDSGITAIRLKHDVAESIDPRFIDDGSIQFRLGRDELFRSEVFLFDPRTIKFAEATIERELQIRGVDTGDNSELVLALGIESGPSSSCSSLSAEQRQMLGLILACYSRIRVLYLVNPFNGVASDLAERTASFLKRLDGRDRPYTVAVFTDRCPAAWRNSHRVNYIEFGGLDAMPMPHGRLRWLVKRSRDLIKGNRSADLERSECMIVTRPQILPRTSVDESHEGSLRAEAIFNPHPEIETFVEDCRVEISPEIKRSPKARGRLTRVSTVMRIARKSGYHRRRRHRAAARAGAQVERSFLPKAKQLSTLRREQLKQSIGVGLLGLLVFGLLAFYTLGG